jgi:hypothetical protein
LLQFLCFCCNFCWTWDWGYLITNNRGYWNRCFKDFAESIRNKFASLPNVNYRQYFPSAFEEDGFSVFAFIDNTICATCRVGGGPIHGGEQAQHYPKLPQQAFWTGWKKLHGLKWQTIDLPNGMNYEIWGAASVRHNDNFTLAQSGIVINRLGKTDSADSNRRITENTL